MGKLKKIVPIVLVLALAIVGYIYFKKPRGGEGVVGTAKEVSEAVPEIVTNPGEKVPELNPVDAINPFQYKNPLR